MGSKNSPRRVIDYDQDHKNPKIQIFSDGTVKLIRLFRMRVRVSTLVWLFELIF